MGIPAGLVLFRQNWLFLAANENYQSLLQLSNQ